MEGRPLEQTLARIEKLTALVERASTVDARTLRAMLDEYLSALEQLRGGVREAERRLASVATTVNEGNRLVRKERRRGTKELGD